MAGPTSEPSGHRTSRSGDFKAGFGFGPISEARRVLIEGAWTYRLQARVSRRLLDRLQGLPKPVREIAWKAQVRLCARYRRLRAAGKPQPVVTAAIAREMLGFAWAIARHVQPCATN